jgi:hypothetical protein
MAFEDLHETYRIALALYEMFTRLGVKHEDIHLETAVNAGENILLVTAAPNGHKYAIRAGAQPPTFTGAGWWAISLRWSRAPAEDRRALWESSPVRARALHIIMGLEQAGFPFRESSIAQALDALTAEPPAAPAAPVELPLPPVPRHCVVCGRPENAHPYRHPFRPFGTPSDPF